MENKMLSVNDLATKFQRDPSTIRRWRQRGLLPPSATGPSTRGVAWTPESIAEWQSRGWIDSTGAGTQKVIDDVLADLDVIRADPYPASVRGVAEAGAEFLRSPHVLMSMRLIVAAALLEGDWCHRELDADRPEALRLIRVRMTLKDVLRGASK
jgi:hypothetical protein